MLLVTVLQWEAVPRGGSLPRQQSVVEGKPRFQRHGGDDSGE